MKRTTIILFFGMAFSFMFNLKAQEERKYCGTDGVIRELYHKHPESKVQAQEFNHFTRQYIKNYSHHRDGETSYIIPVVFHVFGTDFLGATVNDDVITEALRQVNIDFHGLNTDFDDVIDHFKPIRATMDVTFELAGIDPDGNATTGINYYAERSGFGNGGGYDEQIQQFAWDNKKYMNVYIMLDLYNDGSTNRSGVAWYPDEWMTDNNLARVVYNGRYLWGNHGDNEFQATLTHEFGHYLNLPHTFDNECSGEGDYVDDTPATTTNYECEAIETCPGAGIANTSNYMDYSSCRRMFTQGQVARMDAAMQHSTRIILWQESNLEATGVGAYEIGPHIMASTKWFLEGSRNDGTIENTITINANKGAKFSIASGSMEEGTHFNISNLPSGLTSHIEVVNDSEVILSLTGVAEEHESDLSNITITFLDAAISGGTAAIFSPAISGFSIDFLAPYQTVYNDIDDATANSSSTWSAFTIPGVGDGSFGAWYSEGNLRFETYTKSLICEGTSRNITLLNYGDLISAESNWVAGGPYPDEHDLRTSEYTVWDGKSGYFGFQIKNQRNETVYGWFGASVSENGDSFTITDYAYNEEPGGNIYAGHSGLGARLLYSSNTFVENQNNDGTIETVISIEAVEGAEFALSEGNMTEGTHYTVSNIPEGLTAKIVVENSLLVSVSLEGTAAAHEDANDIYNVGIAFLDAAFTSAANEISDAVKDDLSIDFISSFKIIYKDIDDISVSASNPWEAFNLNSGADDESYGIWFDSETGNLRFETYSKSMVSEGSTRNITLLNSGDIIGDESNWIAGGAYPDEHDVRTPDYTVWDGKSGFMGFQFINKYGKVNYGWFSLSVSADGGSMTLTEWAYYEKPNGNIAAGDKGNDGDGYCTSSSENTTYEWIDEVVIGDFTNTSGAGTGYSDFTGLTFSVDKGASYDFTLTPAFSGNEEDEFFKVWIDFNQDGDFSDDGELVFESGAVTAAVNGTIEIPETAVEGETRLRVSMKYEEAPAACEDFQYGEVEDYTVIINTPVLPPVADFMANETSVEEGTAINYTDMSTGDPTSWEWTFEGGTPATSSEQNPVVSYAVAGTYTVTLKVTNEGGSDSKTITEFVTITSKVTGLERSKFSANVKLFPNPNNGLFNLNIESEKEAIKEIRIIDLNGKEVYVQTYLNNTSKINSEIDLSNQTKGIYILMILGEESMGVRKILLK